MCKEGCTSCSACQLKHASKKGPIRKRDHKKGSSSGGASVSAPVVRHYKTRAHIATPETLALAAAKDITPKAAAKMRLALGRRPQR